MPDATTLVLPPCLVLALAVESGLLVGLAVPGTSLVLAAGVAARVGVLPLPVAVIAAVLGVVTGAGLGLHLGRRRDRLPGGRITTGTSETLRESIRRRPVATLLAGPWLSVGRVLVPRAAAWSGAGGRRFACLYLPSAAAWAMMLTVIGYLGGEAARAGVGRALGGATVVALAVAVVLARRRASTPARTRRAPTAALLAIVLATATAVAGCATAPPEVVSSESPRAAPPAT